MVFGLRNKTLMNAYPSINIDQVFALGKFSKHVMLKFIFT